MKKKWFATAFVVSTSMLALLLWFCLAARTDPQSRGGVLAVPLDAPIVTAVNPTAAPNDLDTLIVITGTGFTAGLSGTVVIAPPTAYLNSTPLQDLVWVNSATLSATIPWGLAAGVYTLTVVNPDGQIGLLPNAFTVTQGIGVWVAGELYGGEFIQVTFHPTQLDILYAQSAGAGLFRSRDHGATWSLAYNRAQGDLAVSPAAPDRIYLQGAWLLQRSDDQGDTWVSLQPPYSNATHHYTPLSHPAEPDTVYAAASTHLANTAGGVFKSTDAGQTWITLTDGLTDTNVTAIAFHPTDPLTMYVGTASGNVFISGDGGDHWAWASRPVERVRTLVVEPWDDFSVWVDCPGGTIQSWGEMKRSLNPELTHWETINPTPWQGFQGNVSFSPVQTGTIFIGGGGQRGWHTDDDGQTWSEFTNAEMAPIWFAFDPTDAKTVFAADAARGMFKTTDGGETWQVNNHGLAAMMPVQVATPPGQPQEVYAVFDRWLGLFKSSQGGSAWQYLPPNEDGTNGFFLIDPSDPERIYQSTQGSICISQDGGVTWPICTFVPRPDWCQLCISGPRDIEPNPNQSGELIAGMSYVDLTSPLWPTRSELYRSTDSGLSWELITSTPPISIVVNIVYDPVDPQMVYVATTESGILRSADNGQSWVRIGTELPMAFTEIFVEPVYPYRLIVPGLDGYFHTSIDHGDTWQEFQPHGLVDNMHQYLFTPQEPPVLYAASPTGLIRSFDCGQNWSRAPGALGYANIVSLDATTAEGRIILYVGTTGGTVEPLASLQAGPSSQMLTAGVYRLTTLLLNQRVYLPLVFKGDMP